MLINSLGLKNFKCFEELDVKFAPITLLTGANSSGKSSLINAILAVLQTADFPFYLSPNGDYVNMGSFEEMLSWNKQKSTETVSLDISAIDYSNNKVIYKTDWRKNNKNNLPELFSLNIKTSDHSFEVELLDDGRYSLTGTIFNSHRSIEEVYKKVFKSENIIFKSINETLTVNIYNSFFNSFEEMIKGLAYVNQLPALNHLTMPYSHNYIGSFRLPPERTYYQKSKAQEKVGISGEGYVDQIIEWEETGSEAFPILIETLNNLDLCVDIKSTKLKGGRFEIGVKTNINGQLASLNDVGFGVSQFLPIIVANLQLSGNSFQAISQPEIHLHPKIQATFGNYLADQIKRTKQQYIIETHSEYLLNRIRLLLVTGELKPEDVCVLYFENDGLKSATYNIEFTTDGQVKGAPESFFDTYGIDVMNIAMEAIK